jgi:hypothetical protein
VQPMSRSSLGRFVRAWWAWGLVACLWLPPEQARGACRTYAACPLNISSPWSRNNGCGVVIGGGSTQIDNTDDCFSFNGWMFTAPGYGQNGSTYFTYSNGGSTDTWGQWNLNFSQGGGYHVDVFVTRQCATTGNARYQIHHNGATDVATVNQNAYSDQWVSLGDFYFGAGGGQNVYLDDASGEPTCTVAGTKVLAFDAIRVTAHCGNGSCEGNFGENCGTCPQDCGCGGGNYCINNGCQNPCGNGSCEPQYGENCGSCGQDCGCDGSHVCSNSQCIVACGDGSCEANKGENCSTCPQDCGCAGGNVCASDGACHACGAETQACCGGSQCNAGLECSNGTCIKPCGDGACNAAQGENCTTCPADCGCPANTLCGSDSTCQACGDTTQQCCAASQCQPGLACQGGACAIPCGDGTCNVARGENCSTCPADCGCGVNGLCTAGLCQACGASGETCCANSACGSGLSCIGGACKNACGNGTCEAQYGENCTTCAADCVCSLNTLCTSGMCQACGSSGQGCCANSTCGGGLSCIGGSCVNPCGNGTCEAKYGENCGTCAQDCGCASDQLCSGNQCVKACGDGVCDASRGENCTTCAADCGCAGSTICDATHACVGCGMAQSPCCANSQCLLGLECLGGTCVAPCGDGTCDAVGGESCTTCVLDCACAAGTVCGPASTCQNCGGVGNLCCAGQSCGNGLVCGSMGTCANPCGDGVCEASRGETCTTCAVDCGCGAGKHCQADACLACGGGGAVCCDGNLCNSGFMCGSQGTCTPANTCGNGVCESARGETCTTCPADCGCPMQQTCVAGACQACGAAAGELCCGQGVCGTGLECSNGHCALACGNGACESNSGETCSTCAADCACNASSLCANGRCAACGDQGEPCCANQTCRNGDTCEGGKCVQTCGDGACDAAIGENCSTCARDCACATGQSCFNQQCLTLFRLKFPLAPGMATLDAVFDHAQRAPYAPDQLAVAFNGERADSCAGTCQAVDIGGRRLEALESATISLFLQNAHVAYGGGAALWFDGHPGVDFRTQGLPRQDGSVSPDGYGVSILSAADGTVICAGTPSSTGRCPGADKTNEVVVDHGNGYQTRYLHGLQVLVTAGQRVKAGDALALSGAAGSNSQAFLHFQVDKYVNGAWIPVDPYGWTGPGTDPYTRADNADLWVTGVIIPPHVTVGDGTTDPGTEVYDAPETPDAGPPIDAGSADAGARACPAGQQLSKGVCAATPPKTGCGCGGAASPTALLLLLAFVARRKRV